MNIRMIRTFQAHRDRINALIALPEQDLFVSASADGMLGVWDIYTPVADVRVELSAQATPCCLAPFPTGQFFACGCQDGSVLLFNGEGGEVVRTLPGISQPVQALAISQNGEWITAATESGDLQVWNSTNGAQPYSFDAFDQPVSAVAPLAADQALLIARAALYRLVFPTGEIQRDFDGSEQIRALLPAPGQGWLIYVQEDGRIIRCPLTGGEYHLLLDAGQTVSSVLLAASRQLLFVMLEQPEILICDLESGDSLYRLALPAPLAAAAIAHNEGFLIAGFPDGSITIYELLA